MSALTIEAIKETLPDVPVRYCGKAYNAWLRGRLVQFPTLYISELGVSCTASWSAIQHVLNNGTSIKMHGGK